MNIKRGFAFATAALLMMVCASPVVQACTIFMAVDGETVLAGNNEDWMYSYSTSMTVTAPSEGSYGRVCFYISSYVQGGMNEYGLFYDGATCPSSEVPYAEDATQLTMQFGELLLSRCTSVKEAVDMLKDCNVPAGFSDHLLLADASGDSVVLEWMNGELHVIPREQDYQLVTNFWLTDPSLGGYPCARYDAAEQMFGEQLPTPEQFARILDATKQDWGDGGTLYSNIYNLTERTVCIFKRGEMHSACSVDLMSELALLTEGEAMTQSIEGLSYDVDFAAEDEGEVIVQLPVRSAAEQIPEVTQEEDVPDIRYIYLWMAVGAALLTVCVTVVLYLRVRQKR
ncbi:MAG: carcinine hydrolase/isopenicillin-N N-acyltransferase family protein [Acetanaerobacterium sp.]